MQSVLIINIIWQGTSMDFRTNKCNHGERARCINCLTKQLKVEKKMQQQKVMTEQKKKCVHPPNMKCLKCMSNTSVKVESKECHHSSYERCVNCKKQQFYQTFEYYVQKLGLDCKHKKPCKKCVPIQARKTFGIDLECRNHLPFPQAQCDACMAPTISLMKQPYSHVKKVVIRTTSIHRIVEANLFGILLGTEKDGVVFVEDIYFPDQQQPKSHFLSPDILHKFQEIFSVLGYSQVGLIYSSSEISALGLMLSSMFQEQCITIDKNGFQISKFITMRLHWDQQNPYFECFMVSDQFEILHRNNLVFEKSNNKDYFDLITVKADKNDKTKSFPTFLRNGVETDQIYFKEIIVWIETISQENFFTTNNMAYPYYTLDEQSTDSMQMLLAVETVDPIEKYRNIQFILHMHKLFGMEKVMLFLTNFIYDDPELFISELLKEYKKQKRGKEGYPFFRFKS